MNIAKLLLRIGLAFVFLYAAIGSLTFPINWVWYIPDWMRIIIPVETQLILHALAELVLGIWLLSGWKIFYVAIFAAVDLLVITVINLNIMDIVFRDVGLFFAATALAFLYKDQSKR